MGAQQYAAVRWEILLGKNGLGGAFPAVTFAMYGGTIEKAAEEPMSFVVPLKECLWSIFAEFVVPLPEWSVKKRLGVLIS